MKNDQAFKYENGTDFTSYLSNLRLGEDRAWEELIVHFRQRAIPYLRKKVGYFSAGSVISVDYFVEEIFANSLVKFYEIFETGEFENLGHLRGLLFRIIDNQLLAGYKRKKREQLVSYSETIENEAVGAVEPVEKDMSRQGLIQNVEQALKQLPDTERMILHHFSVGGKLIDIAEELGLSAANCRKKKQRAMEKLQGLLKPLLTVIIGYWVVEVIGYFVSLFLILIPQYSFTLNHSVPYG